MREWILSAFFVVVAICLWCVPMSFWDEVWDMLKEWLSK
jgi:hypothetical protein